MRRRNSNLLPVNGGHIVLTKEWGQYILHHLGYVKGKSNSKTKVTPDDFTQLKSNVLADVRAIVEMEEIPPALILNWDLTGLKYVPVSSLDGSFLPIQLIYCAKTCSCLPPTKLPPDLHIMYSRDHWANESTSKDHVEKNILPYFRMKRQELNLAQDHHPLCIFDNFKGQLTDDVLQLLERNHNDIVFVPPNCTDHLQLLDLSVNKPAKAF